MLAGRKQHSPQLRLSGVFLIMNANEPIISLALEQVVLGRHPYALVVHDWSRLQFRTHNGKEERLKMTQGGEVGYE
ncbi:hypothetical protein [Candidatus Hamiltonella defensa]|uniref:hypothetical protein n=1 Tax=Candidatus Williamhamiltonella defendens TaxID=138072 RepID=UPI0012FD7020|nr:hypothetical protein [Candidatus Hamiltonella defensa]